MMFEWYRCLGTVVVILSACASRNEPARVGTVKTISSSVQPKEQDDCASNERAINSVAVCNLQSPGKFRVINRTHEPVNLLARVRVEVQGQSGNWRLTPAKAYLVARRDSASEWTACLTLQPREELSPPQWGGFDCTNPFGPNCSGNYAVGGRLRFVVLSCDKSQRFEGLPFGHIEYTIEAM